MNIFILRHGEAGFALKDRDRNLTQNGVNQIKSQTQFLLTYLKQNNLNLDYILVSPYVRAQESFTTLELEFKNHNILLANISENCNLITPSGDTFKVIDKINTLYNGGKNNILIISHLPLVDNLVYDLTDNNLIYFNTASMAIVKYNELKNDFLGVFHPK